MASRSDIIRLHNLPLAHVDGQPYSTRGSIQSGIAHLSVGGVYTSGLPSYSHGEAATVRFTSDGKLMVDTELTLDGNVYIDNLSIYATDIADSTTSGPALIDTDGHVQVDVISSPGAGSLNEDAPHSSGDAGTMGLGVRNDTLATLVDTDGDYAPLQIDEYGALYVEVAKLGGQSPDLGTGATGTGTLRVTIASDDSVMSGIFEATTPPTPGVAQSFATSTSSARNGTNFTSSYIRIFSPVDCFYALGDSSVTATTSDFFLPGGISYDLSIDSNTRIAAILSAGSSILYITEWS